MFLYTDGLIERRGESLDRGLERLRQAAGMDGSDVESACDAIIRRMIGVPPAADDTALLAIRRLSLGGRPLHLRLPAAADRLAPARRVLRRWLRQNGVGEPHDAEITLACGEACANAVQHAYGSAEGWIDLTVSLEGTDVAVTVRDDGQWREPDIGDVGESGRGLRLMRVMMDRVDLVRGNDGTEVRMRKSALSGHV